MRSRQNLTEQFSTFLQLEEDRAGGWLTDARLRRSMHRSLEQIPEASTTENFWSVYWHKQWQQQPGFPAGDHLSAYLQEACYWSAQKASLRLESSQTRLADCFQVEIAAVPKILKAFDSDQLPSLKTYAGTAFSNAIRDDLRQRREVDRCNNWGLLLKLSRKQLTEALQAAGFDPTQVNTHLLAWACFTDSYCPKKDPGIRKLAAPDQTTWNAIAQLYNQRRAALTPPAPEATATTVERWLETCASRARAYLYPAVTSLNMPKVGQESGELQDDLADDAQDSLLTSLIAQEEKDTRQTQQQQLNEVLKTAIAQLDPALQQLLQLYYQQNLTQQQIAKQLNLQQYAISRKLTKARETLLLTLTNWCQTTLHISPTSDVVKYISTTLEEWLQAHFQASSPVIAGESYL